MNRMLGLLCSFEKAGIPGIDKAAKLTPAAFKKPRLVQTFLLIVCPPEQKQLLSQIILKLYLPVQE
jgi:hypothetical protein